MLGWAAGLGSLGLHTLLVTPEYGVQVRLVSVLTDCTLPADPLAPLECNGCGRCIKVCPARAIKDDRQAFDVRACHEQLLAFNKLSFVGHCICGICIKACGR